MRRAMRQRRYKNVDKSIKQLKRMQRLYSLDQLISYFFGFAAIVYLVVGITMAGMTGYSFLVCNSVTDGTVQRMEIRDLNDHGIPYLGEIQQSLQPIVSSRKSYPVITYQVNKKNYTHKSSAALGVPDSSSGHGYVTQIRYETMQPEHSFLQFELMMKAIKAGITCTVAILLFMIARILKKPNRTYLKILAQYHS